MKFIKHLILSILVILMMFPVFFVIVGSTNDSGWAFNIPISLSFGSSFLINYNSVANNTFHIWNSLFISLSTALITSIISLLVLFLGAYALSKYDFKYKGICWSILIALALIPEPAYLIGQLDIINRLGMYSTFIGLILPFIINLRVLIYLKESCTYIPNELIQAGRAEGAGELTIIRRIAIPHIKDKLLMASFLLFISNWNNFLIPMIITTDSKLFNLPTLISSLADPFRYDLGAVFMGLLFSIVPVLILFSFLSNYIYDKDND